MTEAMENCRHRKLGKCVMHTPETEKFKRTQGKGEGTPRASGEKREPAWEAPEHPCSPRLLQARGRECALGPGTRRGAHLRRLQLQAITNS